MVRKILSVVIPRFPDGTPYRYKRSHCYYGNDYLYRNDIRLTSSQQRIIDNYQSITT